VVDGEPVPPEARVLNLAVAREAAGRGLGRKLLRHLLDEARGKMLETATFPVGIIVFLMSDRKSGFWVNSIIYDRTAMAALSLTLHVLDLKEEQGRTLAHLSNVVSLATRPINVLAYGDLSNPADDWIDLGKELGLVAIHNAGVKLAERLGVVVESLVGRR